MRGHRSKRGRRCGHKGAHVQLVMDIGSILQQGVHHLGVSVLRGDGERCATVLPQKQEKQASVYENSRQRCKKQPKQNILGNMSPYLYAKHSESQSEMIASQQQSPSHPVL